MDYFFKLAEDVWNHTQQSYYDEEWAQDVVLREKKAYFPCFCDAFSNEFTQSDKIQKFLKTKVTSGVYLKGCAIIHNYSEDEQP